jgi:ABC-type multidrug transport system ATPase subunit
MTIRGSTRIAHQTAIVAAYQAGENFTLTFDKVTILYLGRQIFFGKLDDAKMHFEELGFQCKTRQTTADFLTAITDPTGSRVIPGWEHRAPRSPDDFVRSWKESRYYTQLRREIDQYETEYSAVNYQLEKLIQLQSSQKLKHQRANSPYVASIQGQLTSVTKRSFQRARGNKVYLRVAGEISHYIELRT